MAKLPHLSLSPLWVSPPLGITFVKPTGVENRAGRLALRCLALGWEEAEWRGRTVSRALERRPAKVSLSAARGTQGEVVEVWEDRSGGGEVCCFGGTVRDEGAWEKEYEEGGTQIDMLRLRRPCGTGCRPVGEEGETNIKTKQKKLLKENRKVRWTGKKLK